MKVVIVGGGLVGALQSVYMARRGHEVHLYEYRSDIRNEPRYQGLSINLALSQRGISALAGVGVDEKILKGGIPMHARMIHAHDGKQSAQPYGRSGQCIRSIDRRNLNEVLLTEAEKHDNVYLHFEHKLRNFDVRKNELKFEKPDGQQITVVADLVLGCDGANSQVRRSMMRRERVNFQQFYIPHGYKELTVAPKNGDYQLKLNYLHIWPRSTFMLIALPNLDKTFTATLFMPFDKFDALQTPDDIYDFFMTEFPDFVPLLGQESLVKQFLEHPTGPLVTVKCDPLATRKVALMGDAAHAIVPFYGQGMNAGFEDCEVISKIFDKHGDDFEAALAEYSSTRSADVKAIADLALYNYVEMRDLVNSRWFLFRKKVDNILHALLPDVFIPLYTMVTFSQIPYATVIDKHRRQSRMVNMGLAALGTAAVAGAGFALTRAARNGDLARLGNLLPAQLPLPWAAK